MVLHGELRFALFFTIKNALPFPANYFDFSPLAPFFLVHQTSVSDIRYVIGETFPTCTEAVHCVALWTRVTLGLDMCKVCTEAVHCVALWTRVTLGLDMCKVCKKSKQGKKCILHHGGLWTVLQLPVRDASGFFGCLSIEIHLHIFGDILSYHIPKVP